MSNDEEALRRLLIEAQVLRGTLDTFRARLNMIENALSELQIANASLQGLKGKNKETSILVPVGGRTHIKAKLEDSEKVVIGIGAGVATEKTFEGAQETIGRQMTELQRSRMALQQRMNQTVASFDDVQDKIQSMTEALQGKRIV